MVVHSFTLDVAYWLYCVVCSFIISSTLSTPEGTCLALATLEGPQRYEIRNFGPLFSPAQINKLRGLLLFRRCIK